MKNRRVLHVCRPTKILLRIALPLILLVAVYILVSYLVSLEHDPVMANSIYPPLAEYILASLLITAAGAFMIQSVNKK